MMSDQTDATTVTQSTAQEREETGSDEEEAEEQEEDLSLDLIFEVLKNERRRRVLHYLNDNEGPASLRTLSEHIAALENDKTVAELNSQERKRVYVGLYQCHLPKMDDMGFVEFNKDRGIIELGPAAAAVDKYLDDPSPDRPWPLYYLLIAGASWLGIAAAMTAPAAIPGGLVSVALLSCLAVTLTAGSNLYLDRSDVDWLPA